ncbi:MAG: hypothetical protein V1495_08835 [Pseudomonadota bacterium]
MKLGSLEGRWRGAITVNLRETTAGGNPQGDGAGTRIAMELRETKGRLIGTVETGESQKETVLADDQAWTFDDGTITWTGERASFKEIPPWVATRLNLKPSDLFLAYRYLKGTVKKTGGPCLPGKDIPAGFDRSGVWVFKLESGKMRLGVYYTYPSGGQRILEQELKRI